MSRKWGVKGFFSLSLFVFQRSSSFFVLGMSLPSERGSGGEGGGREEREEVKKRCRNKREGAGRFNGRSARKDLHFVVNVTGVRNRRRRRVC